MGTRTNGSRTIGSGLGQGNNCPRPICPGPICPRIIQNIDSQSVAYAGFFNGGVSVTSHRDGVSFSDVTAIIVP